MNMSSLQESWAYIKPNCPELKQVSGPSNNNTKKGQTPTINATFGSKKFPSRQEVLRGTWTEWFPHQVTCFWYLEVVQYLQTMEQSSSNRFFHFGYQHFGNLSHLSTLIMAVQPENTNMTPSNNNWRPFLTNLQKVHHSRIISSTILHHCNIKNSYLEHCKLQLHCHPLVFPTLVCHVIIVCGMTCYNTNRKGTRLCQEDLVRLRQVLTDYNPQALISTAVKDSVILTIDTSCSHLATGCKEVFVPGTIIDLKQPLEMEGITNGLIAHQKGCVKYIVLTDNDDVHDVIEMTEYLIDNLPCQLFSQ